MNTGFDLNMLSLELDSIDDFDMSDFVVTEKEVRHFTFKKWTLLYEHFKCYHNFFMKQALFKEEKTTHQSSDEWLP